jgi:MFS family permease
VFLAASVLMAYSHVFGIFFFFTTAGYAFLFPDKAKMGRKRTVFFSILYVVVCSPLILLSSQVNSWIKTPTLFDVYRLFSDMLGGKYAIAACIVIFILFLINNHKHLQPVNFRSLSSEVGFVAAVVFLPIAGIFVLSQFKSAFLSRYFVFAVPFLLILIAYQCSKLDNAIIRNALVAFLVCINVYVTLFPNLAVIEDWKGCVTYLKSEEKPGDAVLIYARGCAFPYKYYADRYGLALNVATGTVRPQDIQKGVFQGDFENPSGRLWLLLSHTDSIGRQKYIDSVLGRGYRIMSETNFEGIEVFACTKTE